MRTGKVSLACFYFLDIVLASSAPMFIQEYADKAFINAHPDLDLSMRKAVETRNCEICGKSFAAFRTDPKRCCSVDCSKKLREQNTKIRAVKCRLCGNLFTTKSGKASICPEAHYRNCAICGKQFLLRSTDSLTECCSKECSNKLRSQTNLSLYGVPIISQSAESRSKLSAAYAGSIDKRVNTCLSRYGVPYSSQNPIIKDKIAKSVASADCQQRITDTCMQKYGVRHSSQDPGVNRKRWNARKNIKASDGTKLDSTWEVIVYEFWKLLGLEIERNIPIQFEFEGKAHTTFIDFRVNGVLYEVKGKPYLGGVYTTEHSVSISEKLAVYREHRVVIITDDQVKYMFEPVLGIVQLTGVDINLLRYALDNSDSIDLYSLWSAIEERLSRFSGFIDASVL